MKDIDFDELDKAVNSLMTPLANGDTEPKAEPAIFDKPRTPLEEPAPQKPEVSSSTPTSPPVASPSETVIASATNTVKRSSGRFMDVVHPSSDMRSTPVSAPSRSSGVMPPNRARPLVAMPTPSNEKTEADKMPSPAPAQEKITPADSFPDPLDMVPLAEPEKETSPESETVSLKPKDPSGKDDVKTEDIATLDLVANGPTDDSSETLESLFLPNVKVEKRPLGVAASADEEEVAEMPALDDAKEDTKKVDTLVTPDPTLAELGDDVLAIESDASAPVEEEQKDTSTVQPTETDESTSTSSALAGSAISSIPRQYSVKPSSDDKHHEALYDTAAQAGSPLQHPAKKKSGWMVVLWILLLIVVGVGGALALYFMKVF